MKCPQCEQEMTLLSNDSTAVCYECGCGCNVKTMKDLYVDEEAEKMINSIKRIAYERNTEAERMTEKEIYKGAIGKWGEELQAIVAIEELSELIQTICKDFRGDYDADRVAEEMADVEIVMAQLKMIYHNAGRVEAWKKHKLLRLEQRLREE